MCKENTTKVITGICIINQITNEIINDYAETKVTLRNIDDEEVFIDFGTSISPCIIRSVEDDGDYKYMILPIRLTN